MDYLKAKTMEDKIINDIYFQTKNLNITNFAQIHDLCSAANINKLILESDIKYEFSKNK